MPEEIDVDTNLSPDETAIVAMISEMETTDAIEGNPGNGDATLDPNEGRGKAVINGEPEYQS